MATEIKVWNVTNGVGWHDGEYIAIPPNFVFVPVGDAALTRRIKRASQTVYIGCQKHGSYTKTLGIYADAEIVAIEPKKIKRIPKAVLEAKKKEQQKEDTNTFADGLRCYFPSMPEEDVSECAVMATEIGSRRVGRSNHADEPERLAALAYARHNYTDYESLLENADRAAYADIKRDANQRAGKILDGWAKEKENT